MGDANVPAPFPNNTETLFEFAFTTAKSTFPSKLKSAALIENGKLSAPKLIGELKPPPPVPSRTDTSSVTELEQAKSRTPSLGKSKTKTKQNTFKISMDGAKAMNFLNARSIARARGIY
jgi:hypothetical protein